MTATTAAEFPASPTPRRSYIIAFARSSGERRSPLLVDRVTARILELSDGTRTAAKIIRHLHQESGKSAMDDDLNWIENLFVNGFIHLRDLRVDAAVGELV